MKNAASLKKVGILFLVLGLLLTVVMCYAKKINEPTKIYFSQNGDLSDVDWDDPMYMGGMEGPDWSESKAMFNFFIGLGIVIAVAGAIIWFVSWRSEREKKKSASFAQYSRPTMGWRCVCGRLNAQSNLTCGCGKNKSCVTLSQRWRCVSCGSENPPAAKLCVRCGGARVRSEEIDVAD